MSHPAIQITGLGKRYRYGGAAPLSTSLRADISDWAKGFFRQNMKGHPTLREVHEQHVSASPDYFWALKDISLDIQQGEVVGIIGRNGAGKSTLLKILSRITPPTTGKIEYHGHIASLLEVGTGFHRELTGRENIFLNGSILGMKRAEIARKFDEIVAFAEVEKFIDTPVKFYSSGMYVRLAFAVAAHLEPEILIVDEVLAVGDASFQKKCLGKMGDVSRGGRTVLFVSHNMVAVQSLCQRAILLHEGVLLRDANAGSVVAHYLQNICAVVKPQEWRTPELAPGNDLIRIKRVSALPADPVDNGLITMQTPVRVETDYWVLASGRTYHLTFHLVNDQGVTVLTTGCRPVRSELGLRRVVCELPGDLLNSGGYSLKLLIVEDETRVTWEQDGIATFSVADLAEREQAYMGREPGVVQPPISWTTHPI
ncbi:MAG: polysaccharide ABC transporter ATP-binding protein [Verrucomicrobia bacterium]|nr:polysaccharide ABC transporter ATP-binding protein [Verrucomicrobiota bacterium]